MRFSFRTFYALGFVATVCILGFAYYLQYVLGLQPCALCIFERVAMFACLLVFLVGALHGPLGRGRLVYLALSLLTSASGIAIAARHLWLQSLPPSQVPACGPGLNLMLRMMPLQQVFMAVLHGSGDCAKVHARLLGLSIPGWTLVAFVVLAVWALLALVLAPRRIRYNSNL